jgi:hypothetical protein
MANFFRRSDEIQPNKYTAIAKVATVSWIQSQQPPTQWHLKDTAADEAVLNKVHKKSRLSSYLE